MRWFASLLVLVPALLFAAPAAVLAASESGASGAQAAALEAAVQYLRLRADAALEQGEPATVRGVFSTGQGLTEQYIAEGFRRLHERMGDYPVTNDLEVLDSSVRLTETGRARAEITVQIMTTFSERSRRSCDEGIVATHSIDLSATPEGEWSIVSDAYPVDGTAAYLTAADAPIEMIRSARAVEERQAAAATAAASFAAAVEGANALSGLVAGDAYRAYRAVVTYNRPAVVDYAKRWWNSRNPYYNNYTSNDCANFVSQCTFAGGMAKFGTASAPETRKWYFHHSDMKDTMSWRYCPTQVDAWRWQQPGRRPARCIVTLSSNKPAGYSRGDVAWKINGGTESHALICTGFSGSTPLFSCHSNNRWNDPISTWTGTNEYGVVADQWVIN